MRKLTALILALALVFSLTACSSGEPETTTAAPTEAATEAPATEATTTEAPTTAAPTTEAPTTAAPTTEAPTTAAPTTEVPTTAAPTTEAPTQSGTADTDKAAFYADYKNNVGRFDFVGEDVRIIQSTETQTLVMENAHNMVKAEVVVVEADYSSTMYVDGSKLYVRTVLPDEGKTVPKEEWCVADIPEGEDPLENMGGSSTEEYTYEDDMAMEYLETVEENGVRYDKVLVSSGSEEGGEALFWFEESTLKVWKLEMEGDVDETGTAANAVMEFFTNDDALPSFSMTPKEVGYEEATMVFAMAMMTLLYSEMGGGD